MQIITKVLTDFNTSVKIIIYGPNEIPVGHKLYGRKLYRHGFYRRNLILFNGIHVEFVIFRFCEKTSEGYVTYSLLPFYISPFQRHINTRIDQVLQLFFFERKSMFSISKELDIGLPTIRRWISKFAAKSGDYDENTEKMMVDSQPCYRAASYSVNNVVALAKSIFKKVSQLSENIYLINGYGVISWINLKLKPFLGKIDNIAAYN